MNCGWGTGGFKATPGSANVFAHTIARDEPHPINAGFTLERFRNGRLIDEAAAAAGAVEDVKAGREDEKAGAVAAATVGQELRGREREGEGAAKDEAAASDDEAAEEAEMRERKKKTAGEGEVGEDGCGGVVGEGAVGGEGSGGVEREEEAQRAGQWRRRHRRRGVGAEREVLRRELAAMESWWRQ